MNLQKLLKVKDNSVNVGDPYDNGSVVGKVKEIHSDHLVIESVNTDGNVEDVQVAIEDSSFEDNNDYNTIAVSAIRPRNITDLINAGCTYVQVPANLVDVNKFKSAVTEALTEICSMDLISELQV